MQNTNTCSLYKLDSNKLELKSQNNHILIDDNTSLEENKKINLYVLNDNDREEIKNLCIKNVPFWNNLTHYDIEVEHVRNSITNRVFIVTLTCSNKGLYPVNKLILKKKTSFNSLVSDTELQFEVSKLLGDNYCGPKVLGRYGDYTIQQWVEGSLFTNPQFHNVSVVASLASSLAKFHKKGTELAPKEWDRTPFILPRMELWSEHLERVVNTFNLDFDTKELLEDFVVFKKAVGDHVKSSTSVSSSVLFCHNDLFSLNILDFQHGIYFIDFDFSGFNYVGWEVGSFFTEVTIVYDTVAPPYFMSDKKLLFSEELKNLFVAVYLSQLLDKNVLPQDNVVKEFLDSVEIHMLGVNLFWTYWGIIMMDRPVSEWNREVFFDAYACLQYNLFKAQLKKLRGNNLIKF